MTGVCYLGESIETALPSILNPYDGQGLENVK